MVGDKDDPQQRTGAGAAPRALARCNLGGPPVRQQDVSIRVFTAAISALRRLFTASIRAPGSRRALSARRRTASA